MAGPSVVCPECKNQLEFGPSAVGKKVRCPKCETVIQVPGTRAAGPGRTFRKKKQGVQAGAIAAIAVALTLAVGAGVGGIMLVKNMKANRGGAAVAGGGTEIGEVAREIEAEDLDGVTFKLSDYRGKVVVLDFWGHW